MPFTLMPTSPLFQGLQVLGNSYLLFTGMNDPLLDTGVLEYWEYHIYIYVPHGPGQDQAPSCILRNQKLWSDCKV